MEELIVEEGYYITRTDFDVIVALRQQETADVIVVTIMCYL